MTTLADRFRGFSRMLRQAGFLRNVAVLVGGTALSQGILILISPVVTRLYTPADFGVWSLFTSLAMTLAVVANGRYELAIVLPDKDEEALGLLALSALVAVAMSGFLLLAVGLFRHQVARLLGSPELAPWLWGLPPLLLLIGLTQAGSLWFTRKKQFTRIAVSRVSQSAMNAGSQVSAGLLASAGPAGLIVGTLAGQGAATSLIVAPLWRDLGRSLRDVLSWRAIRENLRTFKNFPLYTAPYSFLASFSKRSLYLLLGAFATTHAVGLFTLAMKLTHLPIELISAAFNQVFFQRAATQLKSGNLEPFVVRTLTSLVAVAAPLLVLFVFNANWFFELVFGEAWADTSTYAVWLVLPAFMLLHTSWLDRIYDVLGRQRLALWMEVCYDVLSIGSFGLALTWLKDAELAVGLYSLLTSGYNVFWLITTFRVAEFSLAGLGRVGGLFLVVLLTSGAVHWVASLLFQGVQAAAAYVVVLVVYYVSLSVRYGTEWRQSPV